MGTQGAIKVLKKKKKKKQKEQETKAAKGNNLETDKE